MAVSFWRELRFAMRGFSRTPIWSAGLILTVALGIGSSASIDGFVRGLSGVPAIARLLGISSAAVFVIACANVASFMLGRATARSRETAVRVAIGAGRRQLIRQVLAESIVVSVAGAACGALLAWAIARVVPALLFDQDAEQIVFVFEPLSVAIVIAACTAITILCGSLPLIEMRHDDPGAIMQRENAGPSRASLRVGSGLVIVQMTACTLLVISAGLVLAGFRSSLQTSAGRRLSGSIVASVEAFQMSSKSQEQNNALIYFDRVAQAAREVAGATSITWAATIPGNLPIVQSFQFESASVSHREVSFEPVMFNARMMDAIALPPVAGRLFGPRDAGECSGVLVSRAAARQLGAGSPVGRSIQLPTGEWADIIGVVDPKDRPDAARVYHFAPGADATTESPSATYRVPDLPSETTATTLDVNLVNTNYFQFMALPVTAGRAFAEQEHDPAPASCRVAIVSREAADQVFKGDAVGAAVIDAYGRRSAIIGVVGSAHLRVLQRETVPAIYFPFGQDYQPRMSMIAETSGVNQATVSQLHRRIETIPGGRERFIVVKTLEDHLSRTAFAPERIATVVMSVAASIAVLLGVLALYGVMSDVAVRRRREFALRRALGAAGGHVMGQVIREGARLVAVGTAAGMAAALLVARWLASSATPADSVSVSIWLAAPICLGLAVLLASVIPARRAMAADPLLIMRGE